MDFKVVFLSICAASVFSVASAQAVRERVIELPVDHFNVLNRDVFDGRYFVNSQHWIPGGVIFIYVSGGFEAYDRFLTSGMMFELAEETNSHLFTLEQRFFGYSRPRQDLSVESLRFLTIQQSVADIASFVTFIRENYYGARNSRVILWGRGYGGNLAVFARQKYPHLVDAVWASSAPINMVLEYPQMMRNTFNTFNSIGGPACGNVLTGAFQTIGDAVRSRNTAAIEARMRFCEPIETSMEDDVGSLFHGLLANLALGFLSSASYTEISDACIQMTGQDDPENPPESDIDGFSRFFVDGYLRDLPCLNYNRHVVLEDLSDESYDNFLNFLGTRQTVWIYCTQMGHFPTSNRGEGHPFGWGYERDFFVNLCADVFNHDIISEEFMEDSIAETNNVFGGLNQRIYRVFFTHGELDPRRNLGPSEDFNENAPVVVMSLQSYGRDFGSISNATDYPVLIETKQRARNLMIQWVFDAISEQPTPDPPVSPLNDIVV